MNFETLGDWCKWLEKNFSNETAIPTLPVIKAIEYPIFSKIKNKEDVIFNDSEPITE
jgi:hypothetical protein